MVHLIPLHSVQYVPSNVRYLFHSGHWKQTLITRFLANAEGIPSGWMRMLEAKISRNTDFMLEYAPHIDAYNVELTCDIYYEL
jgi:hypothetical protein